MYQHAKLVYWMHNKENMSLTPAPVNIDLTNIKIQSILDNSKLLEDLYQ